MGRVLPILFNTEMVQAILAGRKTVTRRVVRPKYKEDEGGFEVLTNMKTGERWLEKVDQEELSFDTPWCKGSLDYGKEQYYYKADNPTFHCRWNPSIHMPKAAARIWLKVTDVRVERLQDIDDDGVVTEGLQIGDPYDELWNSTIKKKDIPLYGWDANPWVWVVKFERCEKPESEVSK